ncbi:MAG: hypothetical protein ACLFUI_07685 [Halanaerobiales bacterium]
MTGNRKNKNPLPDEEGLKEVRSHQYVKNFYIKPPPGRAALRGKT